MTADPNLIMFLVVAVIVIISAISAYLVWSALARGKWADDLQTDRESMTDLTYTQKE